MTEPQQIQISDVHRISDKLRVGHPLLLQKEISQEKTTCHVMGWEPGLYLALFVPARIGQLGFVFPGNAVLLRFVRLGKVYGFAAKVLESYSEYDLVLVEWPKRLEEVGLTSEMRLEINMQVNACVMKTTGLEFLPPQPLKILDISKGGCRLCVSNNPANTATYFNDRHIQIKLPAQGLAQPVNIKAQIRNTSVSGDELELGVQFGPDQDQELAMVRESLIPKASLEDFLTPVITKAKKEAKPKKVKPKVILKTRKPRGPTKAPLAKGMARYGEENQLEEFSKEVHLEDVTVDVICDLLQVKKIEGSMSAKVKCRQFVREWVQNKGWAAARERRSFLLSHCKKISGISIS